MIHLYDRTSIDIYIIYGHPVVNIVLHCQAMAWMPSGKGLEQSIAFDFAT